MRKLFVFICTVIGILILEGMVTSAQYSQVTSNNSSNITYGGKKALAKDKSGNYFATFDAMYNGFNHIFVRKSADGGETWQYWNGTIFDITGTEIPIESLGDYGQVMPSIAVDNNNKIYVLWGGADSSGVSKIKCSVYTGTWSSPQDLTDGTFNEVAPSIDIDNNNVVHAVWQRYDNLFGMQFSIRYAKYTGTWSEPIVLNTGFLQTFPSIAVDSNNYVHVVWTDVNDELTQNRVQYRKFTDSWLSPVVIVSDNTYPQYNAAIAIDSNDNIHIAWRGETSIYSSSYQIRYLKYSGSWSGITEITSINYNQEAPSISTDVNNNVYIVWSALNELSTTKEQIAYVKYTDAWSPITYLTSGANNQKYPSIVKGASSIVWLGSTDSNGVSSSESGVMFYSLGAAVSPAPTTTTPTATDTANAGSASDLKVTFNGAADETNIDSYRVIVVPSASAGTFDESNASAVGAPSYVAVAKSGNNGAHTVTLTAGLKDSGGVTAVQNGTAYKIFVLTVGQNGYDNALSSPSDEITLSPVTGAPTKPTAAAGPIINQAEETSGFNIVVSLGTSGSASGDTLKLLLDGSEFGTPLEKVLDSTDITNGSYTFNITSGQLSAAGDKAITAQIIDAGGNSSPVSAALNLTLDNTPPGAPNISFNVPAGYASGVTTNQNVTFEIAHGSENGTGVLKSQYSYDNSTWNDYTTALTLSNNGTYNIYARTIDNAGNISSDATAVVKIDKTPVVPYSPPPVVAPSTPIVVLPAPQEKDLIKEVAEKIIKAVSDETHVDTKEKVDKIKIEINDIAKPIIVMSDKSIKVEEKDSSVEINVDKKTLEDKFEEMKRLNSLVDQQLKSEDINKVLRQELTKLNIQTESQIKDMRLTLPASSLTSLPGEMKLQINNITLPVTAFKTESIVETVKKNTKAYIMVEVKNLSNKVIGLEEMLGYAGENVVINPKERIQEVELNIYLVDGDRKIMLRNLNDKITVGIDIEAKLSDIEKQKLVVYSKVGRFIGGNYNQNNNTIVFEIKESGIYRIVKEDKTFKDIKDNPYKDYIEILAVKRKTDGMTAVEYVPKDKLTRAQLAAFIQRILELETKEYKGIFKDVSKDKWYSGAVEAVSEVGIMGGIDGEKFIPERKITREELLAALTRGYYYVSENIGSISDSKKEESVSGYAQDVLEILGGSSVNLKEKVSREEAAKIIVDFIDIVK